MKNYEIENAKIFGKNFSGMKFAQNGRPGKRSFCLYLEDPDIINGLIQDGIMVKEQTLDDGSESKKFVIVNVNFGSKIPPVIQMKSGKNIVRMTEDLLDEEFDHLIFEKCNLIINPGHWKYNGKEGVSLYLNKMYVTVLQDRFAQEFFDDGDPEVPYV